MKSELLQDLRWRGLIAQSTDEAALAESLAKPTTLYIGFDPTAPSMHVGNLVVLLVMRRFQLAGHTPIALVGGATGLVGDPSGKNEERTLNTEETVANWVERIKTQLSQYLDFNAPKNAAIMANNLDWTSPLSAIEFLRDIGKHFSVNQMLSKDSVSARLEASGISYTEFSYQVLQALDYLELYRLHNCTLQMGGSDQWGNITAGIDLIRKRLSKSAFGLTWPLVTRADGTKFGKTADGAIWLDASRTSPYQFRQYFIQIADADIEKMLMQFSLRSVEVVNEIIAEQVLRPETRIAQRSLARELTALVHGDAAAEATEDAAAVLFGANPTSASLDTMKLIASEVPVTQMGSAALGDAIGVLVQTNLATSNTEARRLLSQKSVRANGEQVDEQTNLAKIQLLHGRWLLLRKGKTSYHLVDIAG
uniref:tyrosine--tRNA ligase n=1 Tax=Candidatus Planktophila sp. TaxID=2175601 RepID=UPI00404A5B01